jgi:DNA-binding transcriptional MocR family regulator
VKRYEQLALELTALIEQGVLRPGERIPSLREASDQHRLNQGTVLQAYERLEAYGLIEARPQSGHYVRARRLLGQPADGGADADSAAARMSVAGESLHVPRRTEPYAFAPLPPRSAYPAAVLAALLSDVRRPGMVQLGVSPPCATLYPLQQLNRIAASVARRMNPWCSITDLPPGNAELRRHIALRYLESGCSIAPDDIVITGGGGEALSLCLQAVARPGDAVAITSPACYSALAVLDRMQLTPVAIPIAADDSEGLDMRTLRQALRAGALKACLLVSSFQNPWGRCIADARKEQIVALLAEQEIPLIEDDRTADLYFGAIRPRPAKAFDHAGMVLHCGAFCESLAPGYGVGWVSPGRYAARLRDLKSVASSCTASLPQAAIAEYLKRGGFKRHLRRLRQALGTQLQELQNAVEIHFPQGTRFIRPDGGYTAWVELPADMDAMEFHRRARAQYISIAPGPVFSSGNSSGLQVGRDVGHCIRLNFGQPWSDTLRVALKQLGRLSADLAR